MTPGLLEKYLQRLDSFSMLFCQRKKRNALFNDTPHTFHLRLFLWCHTINDHLARGNPLPSLHRIAITTSSNYCLYMERDVALW